MSEVIKEIKKLGLTFVVVSNKARPLGKSKLKSVGLNPDLFVTSSDIGVRKGSPEFIKSPCQQLNLKENEVIYVGHSKFDMISASHARVIFVNVQWAPQKTDYGIFIDFPHELTNFITHFLLKQNFWYWHLLREDGVGRSVEIFSLIDGNGAGVPRLKQHLIRVLKQKSDILINNNSFKKFILYHLLGSIYLSGIYSNLDFWTTYPGHQQNSTNIIMEDLLDIHAKLFREQYLQNLLIRHTTSKKSSFSRAVGDFVRFGNQVNTIHVNPDYKTKIINKNILIIDDFTTEGYSFECARNMLYNAGVDSVVCVAIGKYGSRHTLQTPTSRLSWDSFQPNAFGTGDFRGISVTGSIEEDALDEFRSSYERLG
jgi:hypothetical protein